MKNLLGGLAGAVALNVIHEVYKKFDVDAPRVDLVGEEALRWSAGVVGVDEPNDTQIYAATLAADVISNSLYYSLAGFAGKNTVVAAGAGLGLAAGIGALTLTKPLGLNDEHVNKTSKTKFLTVAWYVAGGVVAGLVLKALKR
ncbi:MAG: hypothetical protein EOO02_15395 [Chitinophagaceae bacterium]|nr:MAG: hypothetical protein EOO02_15395 [Chitinophagaceae bacterium]